MYKYAAMADRFLLLRVSDAIVRLLQEQFEEPVALGLSLGAKQVSERGGRHLWSSHDARRRRRICFSRTARRESRGHKPVCSQRGSQLPTRL